MAIPFNLNENWKFLCPSEVIPDGIPVEVRNNDEKGLVLFIPFGIKGLTIKLTNYDDKNNYVKGSYTFHDVNLSNSVTFQIQKDTHKWIGFPEGYHTMTSWEISGNY